MLTPANYQRPAGVPPFRLLISDMDSTVIGQECIDELADCVGLKPQVAAITEAAMRGELDFKEALIERVALLKGLPVAELDRVYAERITLNPGIQQLVQTANQRGLTTVLVSGGFTYLHPKSRRRRRFPAPAWQQSRHRKRHPHRPGRRRHPR